MVGFKLHRTRLSYTTEMLRQTAETVLGVTFGKQKAEGNTWWWNEKCTGEHRRK